MPAPSDYLSVALLLPCALAGTNEAAELSNWRWLLSGFAPRGVENLV